jgi:hypothetical protein
MRMATQTNHELCRRCGHERGYHRDSVCHFEIGTPPYICKCAGFLPAKETIKPKQQRRSVLVLIVLLGLALPRAARAQGSATAMDKIYGDESHCLVAPELRSDKDNPISCYCRDAIADARYVYLTYLRSGKDANLNGTFLALQQHAKEMCSQNYDVIKATETENWKWSGPEVLRSYPLDSEINRIAPDRNGLRIVKYKVRLAYVDSQGHVSKVENFTALDRVSADAKSHSIPLAPVK